MFRIFGVPDLLSEWHRQHDKLGARRRVRWHPAALFPHEGCGSAVLCRAFRTLLIVVLSAPCSMPPTALAKLFGHGSPAPIDGACNQAPVFREMDVWAG